MKIFKKENFDFFNKLQEIEDIKNLKKNLIKERKKNFFLKYDKLLEKETSQEKIKEIKQKRAKEYKEIFKKGISKNSKDNIIEIKNLNKYYYNKKKKSHILKDVSLEIKKGDVVILLGESGSGKSTLLNVISGLTDFEEGDLIINNYNLLYLNENKKINFRKKTLSFVFQSYNLINNLSCIENIKLGSNLRNKDEEEIPIEKIIKKLNLQNLENKYPYELSGGQNQRIAIGRALAKNPKILFADEPTGALDQKNSKEVIKLLLDINKEFKTTLLIVTHNPKFAEIGDLVLKINNKKVESFRNVKKKEE